MSKMHLPQVYLQVIFAIIYRILYDRKFNWCIISYITDVMCFTVSYAALG